MPRRRARDPQPTHPNPRAAAIAEQCGASYQEVIPFFEQGYSAAEIERAYRLGKEADAEAADILAMREAGMDWREVQKALVTVPDFVEGDEDEDEEEDARPSVRHKQAAKRRQPDGSRPKRRTPSNR